MWTYPRCAPVGFDLFPSRLEGARSIDFVDQTEPFVSFDAVAQRRQHAFRPDGAIYPVPLGWGRFGLYSPLRALPPFRSCSRASCLSRFHFPASLPSARLCFPRFSGCLRGV